MRETMVRTINLKNYKKAVKESVRVIKRGGVIIYPTETVYGIGGNPFNKAVMERILKIKNRSEHNPLSLAFSSISMIEKFIGLKNKERELLIRYLPGPYTFLTGAKKKVGIRVPAHMFVLDLVNRLGFPIASTSANKHGEEAPYSADKIDETIKRHSDLIIDGGSTKLKKSSWVIDVETNKILRKGPGRYP